LSFKKLLYQSVFWRGINLLSFFVLNAGMARTFGAAASGQLFFVLNFYALVLLVAGFSAESGLGFFAAKKELPPAGAAMVAVGWTALVSCLLWVLLPLLSGQSVRLPLPQYGLWVLLYLSGYLLLVFFTALFNALQHFILPNLVAVLSNIVLIALLPWQSPGPAPVDPFMRWYLLAFFAQGLILALAFIVLYAKNGPLQWPKAALLRQLVRYALQAFAANLIFFMVYRVDYWLVNYFCTDKALLGNYIQVSKVAQVFFIVPGIVATTVFSVTAAGEKAAMGQTVQRLSRLICTGAALICVILGAVGYWLFPWIFGAGFQNMYLPFLLLVPGILAIATLYPYTAYYAGKNKVRHNIIGSLLALVAIVAADCLLIPLWNISGAALASSLGYLVYEGYILRQFKKEYGIRLRDCFVLQKADWQLLRMAVQNKKTT
jgi:O-antigen/teichoic acid export membrane protein